MKKTALLVALMLLCGITLQAQIKQIAEGPVFEEPEDGFAKMLQFKNGTTMFAHIDPKKGIDVRRYDAAHKETAVTHIDPSYGKLKNGSIKGFFEINGNAVLLISEIDGRVPSLYRIIIDGKTGDLADDQKIAELNKMSMFSGYSMVFGSVPMPDFFVRKDPDSDNYAIASFNSFESDRNKRIEIVAYGADNTEKSRAYYNSPDDRYKYLKYLDMVVIGSEKVCVLAYASNSQSGGKDGELILAGLDKGAKSVTLNELDFARNEAVSWGLARYSPTVKQIIISVTIKGRGNKYTPLLAFVNPYDKKVNRVDAASPSARIIDYPKDEFDGVPVNLFLNADGTFSIVFEQISVSVVSYSGINIGPVAPGSSTSWLRNIAIVNYSKTGEFINDYMIRKRHDVNAAYLQPYYQSTRHDMGQMLYKGNQYKSFDFISAGPRSYVVFNDTERNNDAQEKGGVITIEGVSNCDAFVYPLKGTDLIPKRDYLFGNPESKKEHNLALFTVSDYDKQSNVYATLKLENQHGNKGVKVIWLQP